jgi:FkbH-like protein
MRDHPKTRIADDAYLAPRDLSVTQVSLRRVLAIGSCLLRGWARAIEGSTVGCRCDFFLVNNESDLPERPPAPSYDYDFQILQIPLRSVLPDRAYFRLHHEDTGAYETLFLECRERLTRALKALMRWNIEHGILTFVFNFVVPQVNPMGRLLPRYDLRNMVHFVERLNEALAHELGSYANAFLFDFNQLLNIFGKKYFVDDAVWQSNHGSSLEDSNRERDLLRLERVGPVGSYYPLRVEQYREIGWAELIAMYRTIHQIDMVKLVAVDMDDTLWRGIATETEFSADSVEGWPLGLVEALGHLKRRGVLLAALSRSDETRIAEVWEHTVYSRRLSLSDFAVRKINFRPKVENLEEILRETHLLPGSVVVIDDSPVERAALKAAFPAIRVFGPNPYLWRRILLWSPETQVASITAESAKRSKTIGLMAKRQDQQRAMSRDAFLAGLGIKTRIAILDAVRHPGFRRAMELLNKTNQFNTTGKRWSQRECRDAFRAGTRFWTFDVRDRFITYGIVGVVVVRAMTIEQFVMSCRVIGLDVECGVLAELVGVLSAEQRGVDVSADFRETKTNLACREFYLRGGFVTAGVGYRWPGFSALPRSPAHVSVVLEGARGRRGAPTVVPPSRKNRPRKTQDD